MAEDKQVQTTPNTNKGAANVIAKSVFGGARKGGQSGPGGQRGPKRDNRRNAGDGDDMDQRILEIARVTRVMAGGKRMNFRACVAVGDKKKHQVGIGVGKGADVTIAINKAVNRAKKVLVTIPVVNETIPHETFHKVGAAKIIFKPAKKGRGVIAGGVVRVILELAGVKNITSKILGSNNKINNARCAVEALSALHQVAPKEEKEMVKKEVQVTKETK